VACPVDHSIPFLVYHELQMRRALSISLILFFGFGPLAAPLGASDDAGLPACCRRHGAHHCAMSMSMAAAIMDTAPGKAIFTTPAACPEFPGAPAATTASQAMTAESVGLPGLLVQPHTPQAARAAARLSQIRTRAGRGPPNAGLV
jgi:hypothetical protein